MSRLKNSKTEENKDIAGSDGNIRRERSENPLVFMDFVAGGRELGRINIELRADIVPIGSENFRQLCTGERGMSKKTGVRLHYRGNKLHRIVRDKYIVGGDLARGDGMHSECAFGTATGKFPDENYLLRHTGPGVVGLVNLGPNSNGSQFYVTTSETNWLDEKCQIIGAVTDQSSLDTLSLVERLGTEWGAPKRQVLISDCGQSNQK